MTQPVENGGEASTLEQLFPATTDTIRQVAAAMSGGEGIWGALKVLAGNLDPRVADTGDPVQNARNVMGNLAFGLGTVHQLPLKPSLAGYSVESPALADLVKVLPPEQLARVQQFLQQQAQPTNVIPFKR